MRLRFGNSDGQESLLKSKLRVIAPIASPVLRESSCPYREITLGGDQVRKDAIEESIRLEWD